MIFKKADLSGKVQWGAHVCGGGGAHEGNEDSPTVTPVLRHEWGGGEGNEPFRTTDSSHVPNPVILPCYKCF